MRYDVVHIRYLALVAQPFHLTVELFGEDKMTYPESAGGLKIVPLRRAMDRIQRIGGDFTQDQLFGSSVIYQISDVVRTKLVESGIHQDSPSGEAIADLVYENAYMATIARWQANAHTEEVDPTVVVNIIVIVREIIDGLWPF